MRENTERRESKSPGRALWGWINTTPPRIREGATIHQPPAVVCLSASCTLTTTSILNQTSYSFPSILVSGNRQHRSTGLVRAPTPFSEGQETLRMRRIKLYAIQIRYLSLFPSSSIGLLSYTSIRSFFLLANFGYR